MGSRSRGGNPVWTRPVRELTGCASDRRHARASSCRCSPTCCGLPAPTVS